MVKIKCNLSGSIQILGLYLYTPWLAVVKGKLRLIELKAAQKVVYLL